MFSEKKTALLIFFTVHAQSLALGLRILDSPPQGFDGILLDDFVGISLMRFVVV